MDHRRAHCRTGARVSGILLLSLLLGGLSCGAALPPHAEPSGASDLYWTTERTLYLGGATVVTQLDNHRSDDVEYNLCGSTLQSYGEGDWSDFPLEPVICTDQVLIIEAGERVPGAYSFQLPQGLPPATYRLRNSAYFTGPGSTQPIVTNAFQVGGR